MSRTAMDESRKYDLLAFVAVLVMGVLLIFTGHDDAPALVALVTTVLSTFAVWPRPSRTDT